jgi:cardiolipin synthase
LTQRLLRDAALHGADVWLLVPGKSDVPLAPWAARDAYSRLLSCGARIYQYPPRVLHPKTLLADAKSGDGRHRQSRLSQPAREPRT